MKTPHDGGAVVWQLCSLSLFCNPLTYHLSIYGEFPRYIDTNVHLIASDCQHLHHDIVTEANGRTCSTADIRESCRNTHISVSIV
jgi:hypothetical protein